MREFTLSSIDHQAVVADMLRLMPEWNVRRSSPYQGIAFNLMPDEVITEPVYDDDGNEVTPGETAGKLTYWIYSDEDLETSRLKTLQEGDCSMRY